MSSHSENLVTLLLGVLNHYALPSKIKHKLHIELQKNFSCYWGGIRVSLRTCLMVWASLRLY